MNLLECLLLALAFSQCASLPRLARRVDQKNAVCTGFTSRK